MKKLITAILIITIILLGTFPALAADTEKTDKDDTLAPLWSLLSETGKSIAGMWLSISILAISGAGFLIVYLRRKSYAVMLDDDGDR